MLIIIMGLLGLKGAFYQEMLIFFDEKWLILTLVCKTQYSFSLEMIASQVFLNELAANFSYSFLKKKTMLGPFCCPISHLFCPISHLFLYPISYLF